MEFDIPEIAHLHRIDVLDEPRASEVMNRAFQDYLLIYPLFKKRGELVHGKRAVPPGMQMLFGHSFLICLRGCEVPGDVRSPGAQGPVGHTIHEGRIPGSSKDFRLSRLLKYESFCDKVRKKHASPDSWYLFNEVVDPEHQGKGESSAILKPMMSYFDRIGKECYLETHDESNVPLYEHFGFELVDTPEVFPGLTHYAMLRRPRFENTVTER